MIVHHQQALELVHDAMTRFGIHHVTVQIEGTELEDCVSLR